MQTEKKVLCVQASTIDMERRERMPKQQHKLNCKIAISEENGDGTKNSVC